LAAAKAARQDASVLMQEASERLQEASAKASAAFKAREVSEAAAAAAAAAAEAAAAAAGAAADAVASAAAASEAATAAVAKADALERQLDGGGEGGSGWAGGPSEASEAAEAADGYACPIRAETMARPVLARPVMPPPASTLDRSLDTRALAEPPLVAAAEPPAELLNVRVRLRGLTALPRAPDGARSHAEVPAVVTTRHRHRQSLAVLEPWAQHDAKVRLG